jgi:transposase
MKQKTIQARSRVIGMDLHPSCFSASAFSGKSNHDATKLWTHDKVDLPALTRWAERHLVPGDIVVMESGSNSFECCLQLTNLGVQAIVLESFSVGKIGDAYLKTDAVDSVKIAQAYLSGLAKEVWQPDDTCRERREILACYQRAARDCTRAQNRLTSWVTQHALKRPQGMTWKSDKAPGWMLRQKNWSASQRMLIESMFADLRHAMAQKKSLEAYMAEDVMKAPQWMKLLQICGLRHITVFALAAMIGDIARFKNPKKLVTYFGLNPKVNQSGINQKSGRLAHNGRKDARHFLVQGAQSVLKQDPKSNRITRWGQALAFRKGKQVACIAVARKLITAAWYLLSGFKPAVKEATPHIRIKLAKVGCVIGKERLQALGHQKTSDFIEEKMNFVLGVT